MKGLRRQEQFQGFWCKSTLLMLANGRKESLAENFNIKKAGNRWGKMWKYRNRKHFYFKLLFNDQKSFWGGIFRCNLKEPFQHFSASYFRFFTSELRKDGLQTDLKIAFFLQTRFVNIYLKNALFWDWVHPPKNIEKSHLQRCFRIWGMTAIDSKWL